MNILAVDPGGTTGIAIWSGGHHEAWALPIQEAMSVVHRLIAAKAGDGPSPPLDLVVFEGIVITGNTLKKSRDVQAAIEFIGVGRYLSRCYAVEFATQKPADAFTFSTDEKVKAMGWSCPGPGDHAKSASKHLLLALVNRRQIDLKRLLESVE